MAQETAEQPTLLRLVPRKQSHGPTQAVSSPRSHGTGNMTGSAKGPDRPRSSQWARQMVPGLRAAAALKRPRSNFHHPHGTLQPSLTPVPGALIPSFCLRGHKTHIWYTDMQAGKTVIHTESRQKQAAQEPGSRN